ncbi:hypothetical protein KR222_000936 [Zaprionus bogoriensis]|nr:hypothetical protein KR222_000936 [Zaprionus bogoriensis]
MNSNETAPVVYSLGTNFPFQFGRKVYHIENDLTVNWYQADSNCRQLGGHLLNIESSEEMDAILTIIPKSHFWISAHCQADKNVWISTSTGQVMPYMRWHPDEPNNGSNNENCVEISEIALNNVMCLRKFHYICQAKFL